MPLPRWWHTSHAVDYAVLIIAECFIIFLPMLTGPHHRFIVAGDTSILYPLLDDIVPGYAAALLAIGVPLLVFVAWQFWKRSLHDVHHAILTLLQAVVFSNLVTNIFKLYCGRPRPDWGQYHLVNSTDAWMSFPSGHSSLSAAGFTTLSLYICANLRTFHPTNGESWRFVLSFSPMLIAFFVAASRTRDVRTRLLKTLTLTLTVRSHSTTTTLTISSPVCAWAARSRSSSTC